MSLLNRLLVTVPDFRKEIEKEMQDAPPPYWEAMSPQERDTWMRETAKARAVFWACRTGASGYNLALVLTAAYLLTNGVQLFGIVKAYLEGK